MELTTRMKHKVIAEVCFIKVRMILLLPITCYIEPDKRRDSDNVSAASEHAQTVLRSVHGRALSRIILFCIIRRHQKMAGPKQHFVI